MKAVQPYLNFDGATRSAMTFYHAALGGDLQIQTFGDAKMPTPPGSEDRVIQAAMYFALGLLTACLFVLVIMPAVCNRVVTTDAGIQRTMSSNSGSVPANSKPASFRITLRPPSQPTSHRP